MRSLDGVSVGLPCFLSRNSGDNEGSLGRALPPLLPAVAAVREEPLPNAWTVSRRPRPLLPLLLLLLAPPPLLLLLLLLLLYSPTRLLVDLRARAAVVEERRTPLAGGERNALGSCDLNRYMGGRRGVLGSMATVEGLDDSVCLISWLRKCTASTSSSVSGCAWSATKCLDKVLVTCSDLSFALDALRSVFAWMVLSGSLVVLFFTDCKAAFASL